MHLTLDKIKELFTLYNIDWGKYEYEIGRVEPDKIINNQRVFLKKLRENKIICNHIPFTPQCDIAQYGEVIYRKENIEIWYSLVRKESDKKVLSLIITEYKKCIRETTQLAYFQLKLES